MLSAIVSKATASRLKFVTVQQVMVERGVDQRNYFRRSGYSIHSVRFPGREYRYVERDRVKNRARDRIVRE